LPILDLYEKISQNDNKGKKCDFNSHHEIAKKVSSEAIVLLENDGILPLKKGIKIGVIGDFAKSPRINGGGSATLKPVVLEIPLDELNNVFDVAFAQGYIDDDTNDELLHEVEEVCKNNDTIIFFTGTTSSLEEEGKERPHMNIPKTHLEIFDVIASYSKNVIVILNNGSALNVTPLLAKSNAIIEAWLLGEANAKSLVEIISGDVNPSGRLSETFPIKIEHTPFYGQFPSWTDEVNYNHDIINLGYRYYDTHDYPVRYPFGYGLSYSRFEYQSIEVDKKHLKNDEKVTVLVTLKNVSDMAGYEVVQLYINDVESYYMRPKKELKAFKKVFIAPFETVEVEFILDQSAFSVYAIDYHDFIVESGIFNIMVGSNVNDIFLQDSIEFDSNDPIRFTFTINHPLKTFFKFKPENVEYLVEKYRYFPWYEIEEPAIRVLKRIKNQYNLSEDEFDKIITKLLS
jgi:beta-glucosidase